MKILITGSTGLVGSALVARLNGEGHDILRLTRTPTTAGGTIILWDPHADEVMNHGQMQHLDAVVHLAGETLAGRWTPQRKAAIRNSRVQGTALIARTIAAEIPPPAVFISASAVGYYGDRGDEELDEQSGLGTGFLPGVCRDWEDATQAARDAGIRTVCLRLGFVLSADGGGLPRMVTPFRWGLGGPVGRGTQWMSWVSLVDVVGAIRFIMEHDAVSGPVNLVAPNPVTNAEFAKALGRALHRPAILPLPACAARLLMGEMADDLLLASERVIPRALLAHGFTFQHAELADALSALLK